MLPKRKRLGKAGLSLRPGRAFPFSFGSVRILPGEPKSAVIVSKKVFPRAVDRNRLRRRVYRALGSLCGRGLVARACIVYPDRKALVAPFETLASALQEALQGANG